MAGLSTRDGPSNIPREEQHMDMVILDVGGDRFNLQSQPFSLFSGSLQ